MKRLLLLAVLGTQFAAAWCQRAEVAPLLSTEWGQDEPYNTFCPEYYTNNGKSHLCKAGCVAVAMAQVMSYYRYPMMTQERISGYKNPVVWMSYKGEYGIPTEHTVSLNAIPAHAWINWEDMPDRYTGKETAEQKEAVAWLMLYCGEAVLMKYDMSSSADPRSIADALKKKFGYAPTTRYVARADYSDEAWTELLYQELAAGRPVIYGGLKQNGAGHSFILDGYKDGLFHVNWGGEGYSNDYFSLNQMNPDPKEEGNDGYNREQDAIIGISPYYLYKDDADGTRGDGTVYDLTRGCVPRPIGQAGPGATLKEGLYIINGRKVIIANR
jgi:hypothetical protein